MDTKGLVNGRIVAFLAIVFSSIFLLHAVGALTLSCSIGTTCPYPGVAVAYLQNETGGFDNAHAQNTSAVSLEGLVAWYRLDNMSFAGENGTRVFDWSGMGNNGTPAGGAVATSNGKLKGAYSFDSINGQIRVPYSASTAPTTNGIAVSAWFNTALTTKVDQRIASKTQTGGYALVINENSVCPASTICFVVHNGTQYYSVSAATTNIVSNQWYHLVGVYNGTGLNLYLNGSLLASTSVIRGNVVYSSANELCIGGEPGTATCSDGGYFNGSIDDVMIFNRSLTAQEVRNLYNRTFYTYNNALCCTADTTLNASCTAAQATPFRIANYTNDHVQLGNYGGTQYPVPVCLSASAGKVQCAFPTGSCAAGYTCLGSIASSEPGALNQTNAHIASCNEYSQKICCKLNTPPTVTSVILNSTLRTNLTTENLTVYFTSSDVDNDAITNITDWRVNGSSIAVVNMPFNSEESSVGTGAIRDYSTASNNGTLGAGSASAAPTWTANGKVGGGYAFDGVNDYISIPNSPSLNPTQLTLSVWAKSNNVTWDNYGCLISKRPVYVLHPDINSKSVRTVIINASANQFSAYSPTPADITVWHMYTATFNGTVVTTYLDGVAGSPTVVVGGIYTGDTGVVEIGRDDGSTTRICNETIDEVLILNRSLSAAQVLELYNAGVAGKSLEKIHSDETFGGENWTCAVTPNDGRDGNTMLSNSLIIRNSGPTVTLTSPADNNVTTNRTPIFNWTGFDPDGDSLTYEINITAVLVNGTSLCSDVRQVSTGINNYYVVTGDMLCLADNQMVYKWSARAADAGGYGAWSAQRTLNISALLAVSLPTNSVEFGTISLLSSNDTTDDAPLPFTIQNDGNALVNVNISASDLWSSIASPNQYYRYKIGNVTGEEGAFNWSGSVTAFRNFSATGVPSISRLNYTNSRDIARADVYVQVPPNEAPSVRNSTVTFMSILGES